MNLALIAASIVAGLAAGLIIRTQLDSLSYRRTDEATLPAPKTRWVIVVIPLAVGCLVARYTTADQWPLLLPTLPVAVAGPWLAAIDLDVKRLPDAILAPSAALIAIGTVAAALIRHDPAMAGVAFAGGAASLVGHWILHRLSRGHLGFGDVKLAGILGVAAASVSLTCLWWSLIITSLLALARSFTQVARTGFAYGPCLALGTLAALTATVII